MENDMPKNKPTEKTEAEREIERLEEQVRHAEEHGGMNDTAHHEMLRRAKGAKKEEKGELNGKHDL
jgi:hypothetical protein